MFSSVGNLLLRAILFLLATKSCGGEQQPPSLLLSSPGSPPYAELVVRRAHDDLVLECELRGSPPRGHVWNYVPGNGSQPTEARPLVSSPGPMEPTLASRLTLRALRAADSGHYMCSAPPFSATKYVLVQDTVSKQCARSAFSCGLRCVLADHVCDGHKDCEHGEDEADTLCPPMVCSRADRLNCSMGRCIPEAACCRADSPLCSQPACCNEHPRYSRLEGYVDVEYPPLYDDRRAPDDYGFIQSTIYTVTACALIFMIAVVLLVSAICKMHMKRAALRSYAHAETATRRHYNMHYAQAARFPPCYEASRLLEPAGTALTPPACAAECPDSPAAEAPGAPGAPAEPRSGFGLARLSTLLSSRYRQVPTQCPDVEMTSVRASSLGGSPTRAQPLDNYRSPTYCELSAGLSPSPEECRELTYMAAPVDFFRRRALRRNTLERVIDQIDTQRLTLQLGRFQLTLPTFGRRGSLGGRAEPRPDTPTVADLSIDDMDFVRLNDTYTLNGRTIRLLGGNFENYPGAGPPPYNEAMRYKLYGPPPEYLSREGLNQPREAREGSEEEARTNVEMPPGYDELASGTDDSSTPVQYSNSADNSTVSNGNNITVNDNIVNNGNDLSNNDNFVNNGNVSNNFNNGNNIMVNDNFVNNATSVNNGNITDNGNLSYTVETINSVIDNLPAIDSDVNANDSAVDN